MIHKAMVGRGSRRAAAVRITDDVIHSPILLRASLIPFIAREAANARRSESHTQSLGSWQAVCF